MYITSNIYVCMFSNARIQKPKYRTNWTEQCWMCVCVKWKAQRSIHICAYPLRPSNAYSVYNSPMHFSFIVFYLVCFSIWIRPIAFCCCYNWQAYSAFLWRLERRISNTHGIHNYFPHFWNWIVVFMAADEIQYLASIFLDLSIFVVLFIYLFLPFQRNRQKRTVPTTRIKSNA